MSTYWTNRIGDFFESKTALLTGGTVLDIDQEEGYCPDVKVSARLFCESKSVGRCCRAIIYSGRVERQDAWAEKNRARVIYYFWRHCIHTAGYRHKNADKLYAALEASCVNVVALDQRQVHRICRTLPLRTINKRNPRGWRDGWMLPFRLVLAACNTQTVTTLGSHTFTLHTHV